MTNSDRRTNIALVIFLSSLFILVVYSYSQIDLNLTLSSNAFYQKIQQQLITLGYFQRPFSTAIYLTLLLVLFSLQMFFIRQARLGKLKALTVGKLAVASAAILIFAYPAFSHDIFNYMFDARLLVTHRVNPWEFTALDFPQDLWTRFMRWTHRTYPYGPLWLFVTTPFYILGAGKFTLTLFWFKFLGAASYLASVWFIKKILKRTSPKNVAAGMVLFALNPLILIESLVSAHIDIVMAALFLFAMYLVVVKKKRLAGWIALLVSAAMKFVTIAAIPVWVWWRGERQRFEKATIGMLLLLLLATGIAIVFREPLPWYFITPLAVGALLPQRKVFVVFGVALSMGMLLRYAPYLLRGDYSEWVRATRTIVTIAPLALALFGVLWRKRTSSSSLSS